MIEGILERGIKVEVLKRAPIRATRENLIDSIESINNLDISIGVTISYSTNNHQAIHRIWGTQIQQGKFMHFE